MIALATYFMLGQLTLVYYWIKNYELYMEKFHNGEISSNRYFIGALLTVVLWPVTIYTNEFKK